MANLYSGTHTFSGYKTLAELTGLTFEADKTYTIQIQNTCYLREGKIGEGFLFDNENPFEWKYDGENDLYIGNIFSKAIIINVAD